MTTSLLIIIALIASLTFTSSFSIIETFPSFSFYRPNLRLKQNHFSSPSTSKSSTNLNVLPPPPKFSESQVFPYAAMYTGLSSSNAHTSAVYAIYSSHPSSTLSKAWDSCAYIGTTTDLTVALGHHLKSDEVKGLCKYVRAVSFEQSLSNMEMEMIKKEWIELAGNKVFSPTWDVPVSTVSSNYDDEEDDEEDDDEFEGDDLDHDPWSSMVPPTPIKKTTTEEGDFTHPESSPFAASSSQSALPREKLELTPSNLEIVLDEIRPVLQNDGGDVAVSHIDHKTRNVYLILKGACGSCPSSTVTMKHGIERVLRENFDDINEVQQINDPTAVNKILSISDITDKLKSIQGAVDSLGAEVEVLEVDGVFGVVKLRFRGPNKVKDGVEMAVGEVKKVNKIVFV